MSGTNTTKISEIDNFIDGFQKDHRELLGLMISFQNAVKSSDRVKAKEILSKMEGVIFGHFAFEETYLYPRLRRLLSEITENLLQEQQIMREFITKSRSFLNKNKSNQNELSILWDMFPMLSKLLGDCNGLVFLAEKFDAEDRDDLNKRFKECRKVKVEV